MKASDIPAKFPLPFAANASALYIRTIPETTADPNAASLDQGFPANTFVPVGAGGEPPDGRDFNGILNETTSWSQWQQAGATVGYDSGFSSAIGGYPKGCILAAASGVGAFWISTVDDNTSNPDTGGANWSPFILVGAQSDLASGQCYLNYVGATSINLAPKSGNNIQIAGVQYQIPSGGLNAANTGVRVSGTNTQNLAASTVYLVGVSIQSGSPTLEFWPLATGHQPDTTAGNVGIEIITGHASVSLVGMIATNSSSQFFNSISAIGVISWFNRNLKSARATSLSNQPVASATLVPFTAYNVSFLSWAEDSIQQSAAGSYTVSGNSQTALAINVDINNAGGPSFQNAAPGVAAAPWGFSASWIVQLADGQHTAYLMGASATANTVTLQANLVTHCITIRG